RPPAGRARGPVVRRARQGARIRRGDGGSAGGPPPRRPGGAVRPRHPGDPRRRAVALPGRRAGRRARPAGLGAGRRGGPPRGGGDPAKLADFESSTASMRLAAEPTAPHVTVDNRSTAAVPLADQIAEIVANFG